MAPVRRSGNTAKAIGYALLVHAIAAVLLFASFRWYESTKPPTAEKKEPMKAVVVDDARVRAEMENIKREEQRRKNEELERQQRLEEAKRQAQEAEKKRQAEELRLAELKRKQEEERKQAAELEKKRQAEEKARAEAAERRQAEEKAQAEAAEKRRLAEEERRRDLERKRKEAESALREQMQAEEKQRAEAQAAKAAAEIERYKVLIQQKVERNWVRPVTTMQNPSCVVRVRLVPGGEVLEARVVRSSGNPAFDRSVESAVLKASPLPLPQDSRLFEHMRELDFTFKPKA